MARRGFVVKALHTNFFVFTGPPGSGKTSVSKQMLGTSVVSGYDALFVATMDKVKYKFEQGSTIVIECISVEQATQIIREYEGALKRWQYAINLPDELPF